MRFNTAVAKENKNEAGKRGELSKNPGRVVFLASISAMPGKHQGNLRLVFTL